MGERKTQCVGNANSKNENTKFWLGFALTYKVTPGSPFPSKGKQRKREREKEREREIVRERERPPPKTTTQPARERE